MLNLGKEELPDTFVKALKIKTTTTNGNRDAACGSERTWHNGQKASGKAYCNALGLVCDEYPFHSTTTGGKAASVFCVPKGESSTQGGSLGGAVGKSSRQAAALKKKAKKDGEEVKVVAPLDISFTGAKGIEQVKKTCVAHLKSAGIKGKTLKDMTHLPMIGKDSKGLAFGSLLHICDAKVMLVDETVETSVCIGLLIPVDAAKAKSAGKKNGGKKKGSGGVSKKTKKQSDMVVLPPKTVQFDGSVMACHKLHFMLKLGKSELPSTFVAKLKVKTTATNGNRDAACGSERTWHNGQKASGKAYCNALGLVCDEYPFHSTTSGGKRASVFCVPPSESSTQGGKLGGAIKTTMQKVRQLKKEKKDPKLRVEAPLHVSFTGALGIQQVKTTCVSHLQKAGVKGKHLRDMTHLAMIGNDMPI
ncbi:hypothetical protein HDU97_005428 [Phlyctochytrium planicorne]|nr:hypothetical protein HDU97_005428 [Phlyctochytrium planicorne]